MAASRVLLVEDEFLIRMVTAEVLRDEGFEVIEAASGDEAAMLLTHEPTFDVVLTDVRMPGELDGVDLAILARQKDPSVPVVVVSGYAVQLLDRLSGLRPPATFIRKPFRPSEMVELLWQLTLKA